LRPALTPLELKVPTRYGTADQLVARLLLAVDLLLGQAVGFAA
jgi:hypothetical protein